MFLNAGEALEAEKKDLRGLIERHIYLLEWVQMRSPQSVVVFTVLLVVWSVGGRSELSERTAKDRGLTQLCWSTVRDSDHRRSCLLEGIYPLPGVD